MQLNDFESQLENEAEHKTLNTAKLSQPKNTSKRSMRSQEGSRLHEGSRYSQLSRPSDLERESRTFEHEDDLHSISKIDSDGIYDPICEIPLIPEELDFFHINFTFIDLANKMFSPSLEIQDTHRERVHHHKNDVKGALDDEESQNLRKDESMPQFYHDRISQQPSFYHNHSPDKNCCDASLVHSQGVDHHRS